MNAQLKAFENFWAHMEKLSVSKHEKPLLQEGFNAGWEAAKEHEAEEWNKINSQPCMSQFCNG